MELSAQRLLHAQSILDAREKVLDVLDLAGADAIESVKLCATLSDCARWMLDESSGVRLRCCLEHAPALALV